MGLGCGAHEAVEQAAAQILRNAGPMSSTQSVRFNPEQKYLLEEALDADLQAVAAEIEQLRPAAEPLRERGQPKRQALQANLPRREIRHEPGNTTLRLRRRMQRVGEDIAEKLDYEPGVFTVERHVRGKWACKVCE